MTIGIFVEIVLYVLDQHFLGGEMRMNGHFTTWGSSCTTGC